MEVFDRIGDWFNAVTAWIETVIRRMFGSSNEREVQRIGFVRDKEGNSSVVSGSLLDRIGQLEPEMQAKSEGELKETADKLRAKLADGQTLDDLIPEMFAATREAGRRYLHMRHYDVQLVGGYILHQGKIAEMVTGEGKTLVATLPSSLNALAGHVHVVTVNDYLAKRDMEWMAPIHMGLGLTVGAIQSQMRPHERQAEYAKDITYGTNNEFGFDYLRDNMKPTRDLQVQGPLDYAIVDEIDNILIDEARTPLIISGPAHDDITKYRKADQVARQLKRDEDFEVKEKEHTCHLTDEGIRHAEELAGVESFYTAGNMEWPHLIDNSLKAHFLYKRDVNYVVEGGEVIIVDEHTGRKMPGRQWSDGLHQAVEAKEGVRIKETTQTLATITLQNYFKLYGKLCGMTGTAMTEANEFYKIYGLDVVAVPTNRPMHRVNMPDQIYRTEREKWDAVVNEIREIHETGRPILVGTVSIEKSERLAKLLGRYGIPHSILNAKYHEREAEIVAQAGRKGAVTIATNMAGRGTDIILGGNPEHMAWEELKDQYESRLEIPKKVWDDYTEQVAEREGMKTEGREVAEVGGLHVIGSERHDARRIDLQLRGRAGRQGDPGSSRFYLSLEDDLMRIFAGDKVKSILEWIGMEEGEAIEHAMVSRQLEKAQKRVEERHFEARKNLLEYDEVMDHQRKEVYSYRQRILDGANCRELIMHMIDRQVDRWSHHFLGSNYRWETCAGWASHELGIMVEPDDVRGMSYEQMVDFLKDEARRQAEDLVAEQIEENLPEDVPERDWSWQSLSKWANRHFGLNTNDRELKKLAREEVGRYLIERAHESIERADFSPLERFLADDWNRRSLANWLHHQYGIEMNPEEIAELEDVDSARDYVLEKVQKRYRDQEIQFPVAVGMTRFYPIKQTSRHRQDRDALLQWATKRFHKEIPPEAIKEKHRKEIETELIKYSESDFRDETVLEPVEEYLQRAYGENGHNGSAPHDDAAIRELLDYANRQFEASLQPEELPTLSREQLWQKVLSTYDARYRPELGQAERSLLLEVLDTSWKDHLYYMDHLRSGIGLSAYAQKDPKVEYKREGMRAFETMWDRIGEQVTSAIFRLEQESPAFVGSLWQITGTVHEDAGRAAEQVAHQPSADPVAEQAPLEPGQEAKTIDPIRNRNEKVGRNDPCPCGSGKKYKKCCGAA